MSKDPAFLFYGKDWLEGTAELLPAEKGVYIDLLCYQHQKGDLPADTTRLARLVGLSHDEFSVIWSALHQKFSTKGERIYNERMNVVRNERSKKGRTNKIVRIYALNLKNRKLKPNEREKIKNEFNAASFLRFTDDCINERINDWINERCMLLANANAITNADVIERKERVEGETIENNNHSPDINPFSTFGQSLTDVDLLLEACLHDDEFKINFSQTGFPRDKLENWLNAYLRLLKFEGTHKRTQPHFRRGFFGWLKYQNPDDNPQDFSPGKIVKIEHNNNRKSFAKHTPAGHISGTGGL